MKDRLNPARRHDKPLKRKTCVRYDIPGHAHALTFTCFKGQPLLNRDSTRTWLMEALDEARRQLGFDVWGYVVMPEHVHLLIYPTADDYSISQILLRIKRPVAQKALAYVHSHAPSFLPRLRDAQPNGRVHHRFWQRGGGYDRNIRSAETGHATLAYIHANPVRRGLAASPGDWYWSSARYYLDAGDVPLTPDAASLPPLDGQKDIARGRLRT